MTLIKKVKQINPNKESGGNQPYQQNRIYSTDGISPALTSQLSTGSNAILCRAVLTPNRVEKRQNGRRFKEVGEPSFTLTSQDLHGVQVEQQIRRLTEIESERLQGFPDNHTKFGVFNEEIKEISKTQRYKMCGNAVSVPIVEMVGRRILEGLKT